MNQQNNAVIITNSSTYESRLLAVECFLINKGYNVITLEADFDHHTKEKRISRQQNRRYLHMITYRKNLSLRRLYSLFMFSKMALKEVEGLHPKLLYVMLPANSLAFFSSKYKKRNDDVILVYDIVDMWPESLPFKKGKKFCLFSIWKNLRDNNLYNADLVITECKLYIEKIALYVSAMPSVVYWPKAIALPVWRHMERNKELHICYLGSINHIIDIPVIIDIINLLNQKKQVVCHIIGIGERKEFFISELERCGARVVDEGVIYDEKEKQYIMQQCHYGLNIMKDYLCVGLTMKSVEYLACGLPILNTIPVDTWEMVEVEHIGYNFNPAFGEQEKNAIINLIIENAEGTEEKRRLVRQVYEKYFSNQAFECQMTAAWEQIENGQEIRV